VVWGLAAAALMLLVVLVLALVPDPLLRQRVFATTFDDVESLTLGTPVYFRGAVMGSVRQITLVPETRNFTVRIGLNRQWKPSDCTFIRIAAANPLTAPHIEVVALEGTAATCSAARSDTTCQALAPPSGPRALVGCRRGPDLIQTATAAVTQAAEVAKAANTIALQVQSMIPKAGGPGSKVDIDVVVKDLTNTLASIDQMTTRLNASLAPGKGDIAQTLANVRTASTQAAAIDVSSLNNTIKVVQSIMSDNQVKIDTLLTESAALSTETRATMENLSASVTVTASNLQRTSESLDSLSARLSDDPTYVLHGQRFKDPDQGKKK
jgi:ABC-type transporter Mla subunit MlaD